MVGHSLGNFEGIHFEGRARDDSESIKWENRSKCVKMRLGQRYSPAQHTFLIPRAVCPFISFFSTQNYQRNDGLNGKRGSTGERD